MNVDAVDDDCDVSGWDTEELSGVEGVRRREIQIIQSKSESKSREFIWRSRGHWRRSLRSLRKYRG
jgi:hypothetical protein